MEACMDIDINATYMYYCIQRRKNNSILYFRNKSSIPVFYRRITYRYEFGCV